MRFLLLSSRTAVEPQCSLLTLLMCQRRHLVLLLCCLLVRQPRLLPCLMACRRCAVPAPDGLRAAAAAAPLQAAWLRPAGRLTCRSPQAGLGSRKIRSNAAPLGWLNLHRQNGQDNLQRTMGSQPDISENESVCLLTSGRLRCSDSCNAASCRSPASSLSYGSAPGPPHDVLFASVLPPPPPSAAEAQTACARASMRARPRCTFCRSNRVWH